MFRSYSLIIAICAVSVSFGASSAYAVCKNSQPVFACTTTNGKFVEVCDTGKTIQYTFGRKGAKPEMALSIPRDKATTFQWKGFGRYINHSVQIPNGNTVYEVFSSADRIENDITFGINVSVDGNNIANILCKNNVINNIEDISLNPAPWQ